MPAFAVGRDQVLNEIIRRVRRRCRVVLALPNERLRPESLGWSSAREQDDV
jgi:hypothetical protein